MKKEYCKPIAKKVDYSFEEQIAASSYPLMNYADPWHTNKVCTWGDGSCSVIYNQPVARGLNDCFVQGTIPLD